MLRDLDSTDNRIVEILARNGRASYTEIGSLLGLSRVAVKKRVEKLEKQGLIEGYCAKIKHTVCGKLSFLVSLQMRAECFESAKIRLADNSEVVSLVQITGGCCLLALVQVSDKSELKAFMNKVCSELDGIESINFQAVLEVLKGNVLP
jgi:DNA-binding Lrp family transcriptional regulator